MTDQQSKEDAREGPMLRYARRLAFSMPSEFTKSLDLIAKHGDVEVGRVLLSAGLISNAETRSAMIVLPLHAAERQAALDLIRDMISIDGQVDQKAVALHFATAQTVGEVQVLNMLECDPAQWTDTGTYLLMSPVARQIEYGNNLGSTRQATQLPVVLEILEAMKRRDVVPQFSKYARGDTLGPEKNLFQAMAEAVVDNSHRGMLNMVATQVFSNDTPDSWRRAVGQALVEALPFESSVDQPWQTHVLACLFATAKFDAHHVWKDLLSVTDDLSYGSRDLARWLSHQGRCFDRGVGVVRNMAEQGVDVDDIVVNLEREGRRALGTLLHSAILLKNLPMVEALLDAGASPNALIQAHPWQPSNSDIGLSAIGLAEKGFADVVPMLLAQQAKNAIGNVIQRSQNARSAPNQTAGL